MIIVEEIDINAIYKLNTNNHPKETLNNKFYEEVKDLDYKIEFNRTNLMNYAELIDYPITWKYEFNEDEMKILKTCAEKGQYLLSALLYKEEIEPIIKRLNDSWQNGKWFFRFNSRSSKDGIHDLPYYLPNQIIENIITSKRAYSALSDYENIIYFVKYDENWKNENEYRVFVRNKKVTCISQYYLSITYNKNIENMNNMINWLENKILPNVLSKIKTQNIVADVYIENDKFKIIEFNSFGYWMASGSALFHWINDFDKLYNEDAIIYLRYLKTPNNL
jgi:hypothetical protein